VEDQDVVYSFAITILKGVGGKYRETNKHDRQGLGRFGWRGDNNRLVE
jgi:hypothetical protein